MRPGFTLSVDGVDITARIESRLVSLSLTEKRGDEADQLEITLSDVDGALAFPRPRAAIRLALGFETLIDKGKYTVDEFEWSGPPDVLVIRARSADFTANLANRRDRSWRDTTLGVVIRQVASEAGLQARVDPDLEARQLALVTQSRESDLALLRRLGREHDAVATIKDGRLIFARVGQGSTTSGQPLPSFTLSRSSGDRYSWRAAEREAGGTGSSSTRESEPAGVRARWRDVSGGQTRSVLVGRSQGARTLPRIYASEDAAERAAQAAHDRKARKKATFTMTLATGRPELYPEQRGQLSGFKPAIDAGTWLIEEVAHKLDGQGGLVTDLTLEAG